MGNQNAHTASSHRRNLRPPPGLSVRYQAGATLRELAGLYRLSVQAVRAFLVADGVQIRRPGRTVRTPTVPASATEHHPVRAGAAVLATVHPLRPFARPLEPQLGMDAPYWPRFDLDPPHQPGARQVLAAAAPGQHCVGLTAPYDVHQVDDRPMPTRAGEYTAVLTRCARIGLIDAPLPPEAQLCAECHPEPPTP